MDDAREDGVNRSKTAVSKPDLPVGSLALTVKRPMKATPAVIYKAWTRQFDKWFAAPGTVLMKAEVNTPFYFETHYSDENVKGQRHPHYGRFLELRPNKKVVMTWVTGPEGTLGAETIVTVELSSVGGGTNLRLTHAGFLDEKSRKQHEDAWPRVLEHLDETLRGSARE
jgi:uncharacterized protein YndB with AHSA1/START domain